MELWSHDKSFGFRLSEKHLLCMLRFCQQSHHVETGGVMMGIYSETRNCAIVTGIVGPPLDSVHGSSWFIRGVRGLQAHINHIWRTKHQYYIGEWHFHPCAISTASSDDIRQMTEISNSEIYQCPEPLLLIIGGKPPDNYTINVYVFPKDRRNAVELFESS